MTPLVLSVLLSGLSGAQLVFTADDGSAQVVVRTKTIAQEGIVDVDVYASGRRLRHKQYKGPALLGATPASFLAAPEKGGEIWTFSELGPLPKSHKTNAAPPGDGQTRSGPPVAKGALRLFLSDTFLAEGTGPAQLYTISGPLNGMITRQRASGRVFSVGVEARTLKGATITSRQSACSMTVPRTALLEGKVRIRVLPAVCTPLGQWLHVSSETLESSTGPFSRQIGLLYISRKRHHG